MDDDPDETEGRALYRARADVMASAQTNLTRHAVKLTGPEIDEAGLNRARSEALRRGDASFERADAIVRAYLGLET